MNDRTLVILPYYRGGSQGKELELSLRCWKTFFQTPHRLIVVGDPHECIGRHGAEHLPCPRVSSVPGQYVPHLDIVNKLMCAYTKYHTEYSHFIRTADDQYPIRPFCKEDLECATWYLSDRIQGDIDTPTSYWRHDKAKTLSLLQSKRLPIVNYTTHFPYCMEFGRLREVIDTFGLRKHSYVLEDIYYNLYASKPLRNANTIRVGVWQNPYDVQRIQAALEDPSILFLCNSNTGWSKEFEQLIEQILHI